MLWKRIVVGEKERILISRNGRFAGILTPGEYRAFVAPSVSLDAERHNVDDLVFRSTWADYLVREKSALVQRHFERIETDRSQIAMVYTNGELFTVLIPSKRLLLWRGVVEVTAEKVEIIDWRPKTAASARTESGARFRLTG